MAIKPISVTQLNTYISRILGTDPLLGNVIVKGEVTSINYHSTGHVYLSIMDSTSKVSCFIHKDYVENLRFKLDNGMEIVVIGSVNIFKKNGTYSINIKNVEVSGEGSLAIAFEKLKNQLNAEGLFDKSHKKEIPSFPEKIGIITSDTGAAVQDILKIIKSRNNIIDIIVFPVLVQGDKAGKSIAKMIDFVNENYEDIDTLIVGRGGGSSDQLWAFNEEIVARSIYNSSIPIISSVGHEIDFMISDLVADIRAATPTDAAAIVAPDIVLLKKNIHDLYEQLSIQLSNKFIYNKMLTDNMLREMKNNILNKMDFASSSLEKQRLILEANNPNKILSSGYSVIEDENRHVITSTEEINDENKYKITFAKGCETYRLIKIGSDENGQE